MNLYIKDLKKSGFSDEQVKCLVEVLEDAFEDRVGDVREYIRFELARMSDEIDALGSEIRRFQNP
jgi:uncharacterized protein YeeX (DUF496 family)